MIFQNNNFQNPMDMGSFARACPIWIYNNLLSLTMKWTGPILYKQQLTADQRIPVKEGESNKAR